MMLSKSLTKGLLSRATPAFGAAACRGVYTDDTRPYVFINEHTKVICQGMTGKHVSFSSICLAKPSFRAVALRLSKWQRRKSFMVLIFSNHSFEATREHVRTFEHD